MPKRDAIQLRPATSDDAELLLRWRNEPFTVAASLTPRTVDRDEHLAWLANVLNDPLRQLFIVEDARNPVGMARADVHDGTCELSWSVDSDHRGKGLAKEIVAALIAGVSGPLTARIRVDNLASIRVATQAGLKLIRESDGVFVFERKAGNRD